MIDRLFSETSRATVYATAAMILVLLIIPLVNLASARAAWSIPPVDGDVEKIYADKFGRVFMVGEFSRVNGLPAQNVAMWANGKWRNLGSGTDGIVHDVAVAEDGRIFIGGDFRTAGGVWVNHIAVWQDNSWHSLGLGTNRKVENLEWLNSGELLVVGDFTLAGGEIANVVAMWDGSRWLTDSQVETTISNVNAKVARLLF